MFDTHLRAHCRTDLFVIDHPIGEDWLGVFRHRSPRAIGNPTMSSCAPHGGVSQHLNQSLPLG